MSGGQFDFSTVSSDCFIIDTRIYGNVAETANAKHDTVALPPPDTIRACDASKTSNIAELHTCEPFSHKTLSSHTKLK